MSFQENINQIVEKALESYEKAGEPVSLRVFVISLRNQVLAVCTRCERERQQKLQDNLDRLAEKIHDEIIKIHPKDSGWAKRLQPTIWQWFEESLGEAKVVERPKQLLDIANMPNFNPIIKERIHGVSEGKIFWTDENKVACKEHGACLCVNKERTLWRCPTCNEGAYVVW